MNREAGLLPGLTQRFSRVGGALCSFVGFGKGSRMAVFTELVPQAKRHYSVLISDGASVDPFQLGGSGLL